MYQIVIATKHTSTTKNCNYIYCYLFIEANTDSLALPLYPSFYEQIPLVIFFMLTCSKYYYLLYIEVKTWFIGQHFLIFFPWSFLGKNMFWSNRGKAPRFLDFPYKCPLNVFRLKMLRANNCLLTYL